MVAANANLEPRREHRNASMSTTLHNHVPSGADISYLMREADAVLSVTPNKQTLDLSAYLVPAADEDETLSMFNEASVSLDTQNVAMDEDSREVSDLLDYLNDLGFDSPRSLLVSHSKHQTPTSSRTIRSTARTPVTTNRASMQTPRSVLRERNNQTWPAGAKNMFCSAKKGTPQEHGSPTDKRHSTFSSSPFVSQSHNESELLSEQDYNEVVNENTSVNKSVELDLDASLEALLEETATAIMTPKKTWKFTEEEWQRLEKVQQMAEILLREAEHERESTKRWAKSVHESVGLWVDEQRTLVETTPNTSANVQLKVTLDALSRLKLELQAAENHHNVVKEKLLAIIHRQADTIKSLEAKLQRAVSDNADTSAPTFKSPPRPVVSNRVPAKTLSPMRASRISLSPTVEPSRIGNPVAPSPISAIDPITPTKHDALPHSVPSPVSMSVTPRTQRARASLVDGGKLVVYRNGCEKETRPDGTCVIRFPNGDVKCTLGGESGVGIVAYYHAKEKVCCPLLYTVLYSISLASSSF